MNASLNYAALASMLCSIVVMSWWYCDFCATIVDRRKSLVSSSGGAYNVKGSSSMYVSHGEAFMWTQRFRVLFLCTVSGVVATLAMSLAGIFPDKFTCRGTARGAHSPPNWADFSWLLFGILCAIVFLELFAMVVMTSR